MSRPNLQPNLMKTQTITKIYLFIEGKCSIQMYYRLLKTKHLTHKNNAAYNLNNGKEERSNPRLHQKRVDIQLE